MGMVKKSITVAETQTDWLQEQVEAGHYASESEVIREALREKQQRTADLEAIRAALEARGARCSRVGARAVSRLRSAVCGLRAAVSTQLAEERG